MNFQKFICLMILPLLSCNLLSSSENTSEVKSDASDVRVDFSDDILDLPDVSDMGGDTPDLMPTLDMDQNVCGNGRVDDGESCENDFLSDQNCASFGFGGGQLGCDSACAFDTSACFGCDFYVSESGDDNGPGSRDLPWASLKNIASLDTDNSKTVCLNRGERFELNQRQIVDWEGNPSALLSIRSYGDRALPSPLLSGRSTLLNPTLLDAINNTWTVPVSDTMQRVFHDGVAMSFSANLTSDNSFRRGTNAIEFKLTDGQTPGKIEGELGFGFEILSSDKSVRFVEISEMNLESFGTAINVTALTDSTNLRFRDLKIRSSVMGIVFTSAGVTNLAKIEVRDSVFDIESGGGISYAAKPGPARDITFLRNTFVLPILTSFHYGISISNGSGIRVQENYFLRGTEINGSLQGVYLNPFGSQTDIEIDRNFFYGLTTGISGHALGSPKRFSFTNNIFRKNNTAISAGMGSNGEAFVQHNTISGRAGLVLYGNVTSVENNIFDTETTAIRIAGNGSIERSNTNLFSNPIFNVANVELDFRMWRQLGFDTLSNEENTSPFTGGPSEEDPVFFRLVPDSLANDSGEINLGVDDDFSGTIRNTPPDIGAWEQ